MFDAPAIAACRSGTALTATVATEANMIATDTPKIITRHTTSSCALPSSVRAMRKAPSAASSSPRPSDSSAGSRARPLATSGAAMKAVPGRNTM